MPVVALRVVDVDVASDAGIGTWFDAYTGGLSADRPEAMVISLHATVAGLRQPDQAVSALAVEAIDAGRVVGAALLEVPRLDNPATAWVTVAVPPAARGRGVGAALWDHLVDRLAAQSRTVVHAAIAVPLGRDVASWPGTRFAAARGFLDRHVEDHLVLDLPWRGSVERSAASAGYRIRSWTGPCPDDLLDAYAELRTAMGRADPTGDLVYEPPVWDPARIRVNEDRTETRYRAVVSLAQAPNGDPAGYTLIHLDRGSTEDALQDDTLVLSGHRGRGVGTALKTANLRQLDTHRATRRLLHTWTSQSNAAIRAVNTHFGFRTVETLHEYERRSS